MKQWKVVELDIIIYNYLTHFLLQPQYSIQENFYLAHLQLSHLNDLHEHVKMHLLMLASVSHHLGQYVSGFKDRHNHPHVVGFIIFMLLCHPFHTQPACKAERFICCIKPERDIGDPKKLFNRASSMLKYFCPGY